MMELICMGMLPGKLTNEAIDRNKDVVDENLLDVDADDADEEEEKEEIAAPADD